MKLTVDKIVKGPLMHDHVEVIENADEILNKVSKPSDVPVTNGGLAGFDGISGDIIKEIETIEQWISPPSGAVATGLKGQKSYLGNYLYECIEDDLWVRSVVATSGWTN